MSSVKILPLIILNIALLGGCISIPSQNNKTTFQDDVDFLRKHQDVVVLSDKSSLGQLVVAPALQGRILTSTADGTEGDSYGWINYKLIASAKIKKHSNPYGGEDQLKIGPEGGQFSVFFAKGAPFDFEHWFTPPAFDSEPFRVISKTKRNIVLAKDMQLKNYSGSEFSLRVDREIRILEPAEISRILGIKPAPSLKSVAFESRNTITNTGSTPWKKSTGLLSIWISGMLIPTQDTTVVIPFVKGDEKSLGKTLNNNHFGKIPKNRLIVGDDVLFFRGDGNYRSRIGLSPMRSKSILGSYDPHKQVLTIVQYNKPSSAHDYVNSTWALQEQPYKGDTVASYNNGPSAENKDLPDPFYDLETSSPAAKLGVGGTMTHIHRTIHLTGPEEDLEPIARKLLGTSITDIRLTM